MRELLVLSVLTATCLVGCAQTWGLGERPEPELPSPAELVPSDAETERLLGLSTQLEQAIAEVESSLERSEQAWADATAEEVDEAVSAQQDLLERRLILSVALANVRAAIRSRGEALQEDGEALPASEPIGATVEAAIRQAEEQVRAKRDRRDARSDGERRLGGPVGSPPPVETASSENSESGAGDHRRQDRKAAVVVDAPTPKVDLQNALLPHFDALSACVPASADVSRVIVRGRLSADGHLRELRVVEGLAIPAIVGCLTDRLEAIEVTMPEGATSSVVTFPLHFGSR